MEESTPILVGAGQFSEQDVPPGQAHAPAGLAAEAARFALADTGIGPELAASIDTLLAIRLIADSTNRPRMQTPFGRADNFPRAIARRIGANPAHAIYGNVGGNTPQKYVNELAQGIRDHEVGIALIAGAEAIMTARQAMRTGVELDWCEHDAGSLEDRGLGETLMTPHELAHGIGVPTATYPLFENALRSQLGHTAAGHLHYLGALFEPFSRIAAANPFAFYGTPRTATELATVSPENRFICYPYPKWMNARDGVNQGAAVIMTSVGKARELGIDPARWVFLHGCADLNEKLLVSERLDYHSSPAMRACTAQAFAMAGIALDDVEYIDLYSCFPVAVEIAAAELGLDCFDPRRLTVTGGLPFFGGPGNNYSLHAIATMLPLLRADPGNYGLVTANGGYLSKHSTGIYSARPVSGSWQRQPQAHRQAAIDAMSAPTFTEHPSGAALSETCTVCFKGEVPTRGIVIGRVADSGQRFVANTPTATAALQALMDNDPVGMPGTVARQGEVNVFTPG